MKKYNETIELLVVLIATVAGIAYGIFVYKYVSPSALKTLLTITVPVLPIVIMETYYYLVGRNGKR